MIQGDWRRGWCGLALLLMVTAGCQQKAATPGDEAAGKAAVDGEKAAPGPTTFPGKWALVVTQQMPDQSGQPTFRDLHLMLFEIKDGKDGVIGEVSATLEGAPKFEIKSVKIEGDQITIGLAANDNNIEYNGTLKEGIVRGTMMVEGSGGVAPAMLMPTTHTAYDPKGWDPAPVTPGADLLVKAFGEKEQPMATLGAAAALRGNPLSLEAFGGVFSRLGMLPQADDKSLKIIAREFLDSATLWGPRMAEQVRATVILNTAASRKYPRIVKEWLDDLAAPDQKKISEDGMKTYGGAFDSAREQVTIDIALEDVKSSDDATAKAASDTLESKLTSQRYNPEVLHALAVYANGHEMLEKATEYWGDIVALPLLEAMWFRMQEGKPPGDGSPRELLLKLWETKHGNVDGFDQFLEETYNRRMGELAEEAHKAGPEKVATDTSRPVLLELFTGATCPTCIASDVVLDLVSQDYPAPKVIALRYHQHIPGPDPMANQDSEDRFGYYEGAGTPLMLIDGAVPSPPVAGMLQHVSPSYKVLRQAVDARLQSQSDVQIKVSAALENGEVAVEASAVGWPEDKAKRLRLRMALVENQIVMLAPNGMRKHEHLVRAMIGGAKGTAVKSGQLAASSKLSIADLKVSLSEYLDQFEKNRGVQFPIKPLDLKGLSVVAWVQNDDDREVLAAMIVPVTGSESAVAAPPANGDAPASAVTPENAAK